MPETVRRVPFSGALSRIVVLSLLASGLFFSAPGGPAQAAPAVHASAVSAAALPAPQEFPSVSSVTGTPVGITTGPSNNLIFVDEFKSTVNQISTTGVLGSPVATNSTGADPEGITPVGTNFFFTENNINVDQVARFNSAGSTINEMNVVPPGSQPLGITAGPAGVNDPNVYYTEFATHNIGKITATAAGGDTGSFSPVTSGAAPVAIVAGPNSNLWFTEQQGAAGTGGKIGEMNPAGSMVGETQVNAVTTTVGLDGLSKDVTGTTLWFTEQSNGVVGKFDPATHTPTEFALPNSPHPTAITAGPDGNMYFVDQGNNAIGQITPAGAVSEVAVPTANAFGANAAPFGITAGPDGNIWFTEQNNGGKIGKLAIAPPTPPGTGSVAPTSLTFGSTTVGTTSTAQTVTFTATGGTGVTLTAMPSASSSFIVTGGSCTAGFVLAVGGTCTVTLVFAPATSATPGTIAGTLSITSNATNGTQTVTLSGTAAAAPVPTPTGTFSANPTSVAFGGSLLGQPSTPTAIVFTNNTNVAVTVSTATLTGANPGDFKILSDGCSTKTIAIGAQCTISVEFLPGTAGNRAANLSVQDTAGTQTVALTGTGLAARQSGGYWLDATDGGIFSYGPAAKFFGSTGSLVLNKPIVGMAPTPDGLGYWLVASDGGIFNYGDAGFHGSAGSIKLNKPIVGMASTPSGNGYWLVATDGGIFSYGDARFFGSTGGITLNKPIAGMATSPSGNGYWLVATDGGIFNYGDAGFHGSAGSIKLNKPIVGMAATASGNGYWLDATDGGIFTYGDATFHGSAGSITLNKPMVGMAPSPSGNGYWLVASDGGIFNYGDAKFFGSAGSINLNKPIVGMAAANF